MKAKWKVIALLMLLMTGALLVLKAALAGNSTPPSYPVFGQAPDVFKDMPPGYVETGDASVGGVNAGNSGAATQPVPAYRGGSTLAILGDAAPANEATAGYLKQTVAELNRLRPDLVLTTGNQIAGYTRSLEEYAGEAAAYRGIMTHLQMPTYFCAGDHDVESGVRDKHDRRFENIYEKYFGPLYYSVDFRDVHIITLYSEGTTNDTPAISAAQLAWLARDLDRAFERRKITHVFVLVHRPIWREAPANWKKVHRLLVEFNKRPIVTVEGAAGGDSSAKAGPRVEAVFAGHARGFCKDPSRDDIAYYVLGPLGGRVEGDAVAGQLQHYTMVHVDSSGVHVAVVRPGNVLPEDFVVDRDHEVLAKIAAIDDKTLGIEGVLDQPVGKAVGQRDAEEGTLRQVLTNPLEVPIDVAFRLSSARNLVTQVQKDNANPYTENYDSPWDIYLPYGTVHLNPGEKKKYHMALYCEGQTDEVAPPQVEFVVNWIDSKGRSVPTVLRRRVPLIPSLTVPVMAGPLTAASWDEAVRAATFSWVPNPNDKAQPAPEFEMLADADNLYIKVQVGGKHVPTYLAKFDQPCDLPCDAISVAWAASENSWDSSVHRVVVVWPTPETPEIYGNTGVGSKQSRLVKQNGGGVTTILTKQEDGYQVLLTVPRAKMLAGGSAVLNLTVTNNDGGTVSTWRSWAREDLGPKMWGRVKVVEKKDSPK